jgi:hypothetical protein
VSVYVYVTSPTEIGSEIAVQRFWILSKPNSSQKRILNPIKTFGTSQWLTDY